MENKTPETLTKEQAIAAMKEGKKVRHRGFAEGHYWTSDKDCYVISQSKGQPTAAEIIWRNPFSVVYNKGWSIVEYSPLTSEAGEQDSQGVHSLKVQIVSCSDPQYFYANRIGEIFEVMQDEYFPHCYTLVSEKDLHPYDQVLIQKSDCIICKNDIVQDWVKKAGDYINKNATNQPAGKEEVEKLLDSPNDIDVVGKCANCGVEYHIHKPASPVDKEAQPSGDEAMEIARQWIDVIDSYHKQHRIIESVIPTAIGGLASDIEKLIASKERKAVEDMGRVATDFAVWCANNAAMGNSSWWYNNSEYTIDSLYKIYKTIKSKI